MDFREVIHQDIQWRYGELSILKTLPFRFRLGRTNKEFLIKYSVPIIYALWEGFLKHAFESYIRHINSLSLSYDEVHINLLTHSIVANDKLDIRNPRLNYDKQKAFVEGLNNFKDNFHISSKLPTNSNADYKVLSDLLERFNLSPISESPYKRKLNKLLRFRNAVAHGDNSIPVKKDDMETFCSTVNDLMGEVFDRINEGCENETYKKLT